MKEQVLCFFCKKDLASQTVLASINQDFEISEASVRFDGEKTLKHETTNTIFWLASTQEYVYSNGKYYAELAVKTFPNSKLAIIVGFHEGQSGAILTTHSIGNPSGQDARYTLKYNLAMTSCRAIKNIIKGFKKYRDEYNLQEFAVMQEATHGSPVDFNIPLLDFEIGSTGKEYENAIAGKVLAHTLFQIDTQMNLVPAIGFGGLHYAEKFMEANLLGKYGVGHIFPSSSLPDFNRDVLALAIRKTTEGVKALIIDKKEKGVYKDIARGFAEELGLEILTHKQACQL